MAVVLKKRFILLLLLGAAAGRGEIIDRVAAVVGRQVITQSEVEREARLEAFFNRLPPPGPNSDRRATLQRLIEQKLVRHEMDQTSFPSAGAAESRNWLDQMRPPADLAAHGLEDADLLDYARRQIDTLRFVDLRFRPGAETSPQQIQTYYEKTLLPELKRNGISQVPPLDEVRAKIERILTEQRVNELLDNWLQEVRARVRVRIVTPEKK